MIQPIQPEKKLARVSEVEPIAPPAKAETTERPKNMYVCLMTAACWAVSVVVVVRRSRPERPESYWLIP